VHGHSTITGRVRNNDLFSLVEHEDAQRQRQIMELYEAHSPGLYKYLRGLGLAKEEAEDAIQEAFLRLATHLIEGLADSNLRSWLYQVVHNLSMDIHRERSRNKGRTEIPIEMMMEPADPNADPEGILLHKERMKRVNEVLTQLTPKQRSSILLRAQGLRYLEIGSVLKVSESRAIYLVKRGLMRLAGGL
jgi:RNA polymerase sigma-70 factor (ECF subfamily)